jgi:pyruvate dehydrogenase E2 component (dihydrolipoamide acetyltransferase)
MSNTVVLPKLGLTMEHGIIMAWSKNEGDTIRKGDILFQVESDKAIVDVESDYDGILLKRYYKEGDDVPCGYRVAIIGYLGEAISDSDKPVIDSIPMDASVDNKINIESDYKKHESSRIIASPRAKRLALTENISLELIGRGSGDNGRIKERDVRSFIDKTSLPEEVNISPVARNILQANKIDTDGLLGTGPEGRIMKRDVLESLGQKLSSAISAEDTVAKKIPISQTRMIIAQRLTESKSTIPHYYITISVNMSNFIENRKTWNIKNPDRKVSMNAMIMKIVAAALIKHPMVNASWSKEGIFSFSNANVALAVSTEKGLVTPVVKNCERKSVLQIEGELTDLIRRARQGLLKLDELSGSTFTISNLGMYGVEEFSAIINPPEASILAIASIIDTPVADGQAVVIQPMMKITISADHRVIDGAGSAAFLGDIRTMLEHPFFALF